MSTIFSTFVQDDVLVVSVDDRLSLDKKVEIGGKTETAPKALMTLFKEQINNGVKNFIIDLTACEFIDSSGVGALVVAYTSAANANGHAAMVVKPGSKMKELLTLTKLIKIFNVYDSVEDALQNVHKADPA